jgi:carbamoyl-phosphate synthase small subunit
MGGRIRKMRSGHRAINKAVVDTSSGRSYITTHNHGYAAYAEDVPEDIERWFISPDDNVVEGIRGKNLLSVQFHPESGPGTADAEFIFKHFERMMRLEAK